MQLTPGTIIDERYEVLAPIGMGGFGVVYRARQLAFDRTVALKVLHLDRDMSAEAAGRFEREAQALSTLKHRNIVLFYGFGTYQASPYIVMEFLEGKVLETLVSDSGALPLGEAVSVVKQICDAMACAHANGIVHRDLKPTNIMLVHAGDDEVAKVIDFGLVRLLPHGGLPAQNLTDVGNTVGSVQYMSPEQCRGSHVDHRSDIYAIGCILHRCLTGQAPFNGPSVVIMQQHVFDPPPPLNTVLPEGAFPDALQDVIDRAMAKEPDDRYQSAAEMAEDLQRAVKNQVITGRMRTFAVPTATKQQGKRKLVLTLALALMLVTAGSVGWSVFQSRLTPVSQAKPAKNSAELFAEARQLDPVQPRPPRVEELFEQALATNEKDHLLTTEGFLQEVRLRLVRDYMGDGKLDKAMPIAAKGIDEAMAAGQANNALDDFSMYYGTCASQLKKSKIAAAKLETVYQYVKRKRSEPMRSLWATLAQLYAQSGQPQKALKIADETEAVSAFGVCPQYAQVMDARALAYKTLGKKQLADQCTRQARASEQEYEKGRFNG